MWVNNIFKIAILMNAGERYGKIVPAGDITTDTDKNIMNIWAKMEYFTGHRAEYWIRKNMERTDYMSFYDAVKVVEEAIMAVVEKNNTIDLKNMWLDMIQI